MLQLQPGSPGLAQRSQPISATNLDSPAEQPVPTINEELSPDVYAVSRLEVWFPLKNSLFCQGFVKINLVEHELGQNFYVVLKLQIINGIQ